MPIVGHVYICCLLHYNNSLAFSRGSPPYTSSIRTAILGLCGLVLGGLVIEIILLIRWQISIEEGRHAVFVSFIKLLLVSGREQQVPVLRA